MPRSHNLSRDLALGAAVNTAVLGSYFAALIAWSRFCEAHKHHTR
jgi:hypothetical protein